MNIEIALGLNSRKPDQIGIIEDFRKLIKTLNSLNSLVTRHRFVLKGPWKLTTGHKPFVNDKTMVYESPE